MEGRNGEGDGHQRGIKSPATGNRSPFEFSDSVRQLLTGGGGHFVLHFATYPVSLGGLTSLSFFLSLSLYSPFLRLLEIDDRRSTMTRVYVPVLPLIDPPSGPVRVLKQTRRSRCDPFIPTRTSTSFHTPFVLLLVVVVLFLRLFAPYLPTYLPTYLLFSTWLDRAFSPFLRRA